MGFFNGLTAKQNSMKFLKKLKIEPAVIWSSNPTSEYTPERKENKVWNKSLHSHVHFITIHKSPEVKVTQMVINRWKDKQNIVYAHKE